MNVLILNGHPDAGHGHFGDALVEAYASGARSAGHRVRIESLTDLELPMLRSKDEFHDGEPPADARRLQEAIRECQHLVLVFPLWLGGMPALVKCALEQTLRPGFALSDGRGDQLPGALLKGRSARILVTMGMPGLFYRWFYRAHSIKSLKRNILEFCGFKPARMSLIGGIESSAKARERWLARVEGMGRGGR